MAKNRTEQELRAELEKQTDEKFIAEFRELERKYNRKIVGELHFSVNGVWPTLKIVTSKEEVTVPTKDE